MSLIQKRLTAVLAGLLAAGCDNFFSASAPESWPCDQDCVSIPLQHSPSHWLIDDLDGNGNRDLVLIFHGGNYGQALLQTAPRRLVPGARLEDTGYHPNGLIRLPHPAERWYLLCAEGVSRLRLFKAAADGGLTAMADVPHPTPLAAAVFRWPEWGTGLAVLPYVSEPGNLFSAVEMTLLKNFTLPAGQADATFSVPLPPNRMADEIVVADLNADGIDEILLGTAYNELFVIRYPAEGDPQRELLWSSGRPFEEGHLRRVIPMDIDGDGDLDLLLSHELPPVQINVLLNDGQGGFEPAEPLPFPVRQDLGIHRVSAGIDKDGDRYLIAESAPVTALYRFSSSQAGEVRRLTLPFANDRGVVVLALDDIDQDGWLDLVVVETEMPEVTVQTPSAGEGWKNRPPPRMEKGPVADRRHRLVIQFGPLWDDLAAQANGDVVNLNIFAGKR